MFVRHLLIACSLVGQCVAVSLMLGDTLSADVRVWTDSQGKQVTAEYMNYKNGMVYLSHDRRTYAVPFENFSDEDQDFVRDRLKTEGKTDLVPPRGVATSPEPIDAQAPGTMAERMWTDTAGRQISARFTGVSQKKVQLIVQGSQIAVPFSRFSENDQTYVRDVLAGKIAAQTAQEQPHQSFAGGRAPVGRPNPFAALDAQQNAMQQMNQQLAARREADRQQAVQQRADQQEADRLRNEQQTAEQQHLERQTTEQQSTQQSQTPETNATAYQCSRCKSVLTGNYKAGDMCPNCGTFFHYVRDASGRVTSTTPFFQSTFLIAPGAIALLIGLGFSLYWRLFSS